MAQRRNGLLRGLSVLGGKVYGELMFYCGAYLTGKKEMRQVPTLWVIV